MRKKIRMLRNIFAFTTIFTCLFWAILLFSSKTDKKHTQKVLGVFMSLLVMFYSTYAVYYLGDYLLYQYFDELFIFTSLSIFPVYYLFMVSLTKECIHQKKYLWHIAPGVLFLILYIIFSSRLSQPEYESYVINFLHAKSIHTLNLSDKSDLLAIIFLSVRAIYFVQIFTYILLGLKLSKLWRMRIKESLSETSGRDIQLAELISASAIMIALIGFFIDIFGQFYVSEKSLLLLLPIFLFAPILFKTGQIGYELEFTVYDLEILEKDSESIIDTKEHYSEIRKDLEQLMKKNKLFLTPDLRITSVCEELHTNRTYLSQVLNDELKENFNSYINKHRVKYAIDLLKDSKWDNYSLEKFAELSGFGSTISMIRAFKQFTGKTPSEFRK